MNLKLVRRALVVVLSAYWIAMYVGTHVPKVPQVLAEQGDKLLHMGAYGGLAFLLIVWFGSRRPVSFRKIGLLWLLIAAYGIFDETTQPLFGRHAEVADWLADIVGAALGLALGWPVALKLFTPTAFKS